MHYLILNNIWYAEPFLLLSRPSFIHVKLVSILVYLIKTNRFRCFNSGSVATLCLNSSPIRWPYEIILYSIYRKISLIDSAEGELISICQFREPGSILNGFQWLAGRCSSVGVIGTSANIHIYKYTLRGFFYCICRISVYYDS